MIGPVAQLMAVIGLNTAPLEAGIAKSTGMLAATGPLAVAALAGGAVVAGVGVIATKMAADFQQGITSLATGAGESTKNLGLVSAGVLQLAKDTGTSTQQLIDGMYMIESGGFHGAAGLAVLKAAAEGAKVGNADLGVVADATDTILKNYGEHGALSATQATNTLITTVANGKVHLEDLANSLSAVLPAASAAGIGLNSTMAAMATLTNVGIDAAQSSTFIRQLIISLSAPAAGARGEMDSLGISVDTLSTKMHSNLADALQYIVDKLHAAGIKEGSAQWVAAIREIAGGSRQMQGLLVLTQHLDTLRGDITTIGKASSAAGDQVQGWSLVQKNFNTQLARAGEVVKTLAIQLGQKLVPVATNFFSFIADKAIPALKNFKDFIEGNSIGSVAFKVALIAVSGAIVANLVVAFYAWAVAAASAAIATIAATWPILLVGAAIALLVTGIILAVQHWKFIQQTLAVTGIMFQRLGGVIGTFFGNVFGAIGNFVGGVLGWFGNLNQQAGVKLYEFVAAVGKFFSSLPGIVWNWLLSAGLKIGDFEVQAVNKAKSLATGFMAALAALPGQMLTLGENLIKQLAQGINNARGSVVAAVANIPILGGAAAAINSHIPRFASGGVMPYSGMAAISDNETVFLPGGSQVYTPRQMLAGGYGGYNGNGQPIIVQVQIDGRTAAQAIVPHMPGVIRTATGRRNI